VWWRTGPDWRSGSSREGCAWPAAGHCSRLAGRTAAAAAAPPCDGALASSAGRTNSPKLILSDGLSRDRPAGNQGMELGRSQVP